MDDDALVAVSRHEPPYEPIVTDLNDGRFVDHR